MTINTVKTRWKWHSRQLSWDTHSSLCLDNIKTTRIGSGCIQYDIETFLHSLQHNIWWAIVSQYECKLNFIYWAPICQAQCYLSVGWKAHNISLQFVGQTHTTLCYYWTAFVLREPFSGPNIHWWEVSLCIKLLCPFRSLQSVVSVKYEMSGEMWQALPVK